MSHPRPSPQARRLTRSTSRPPKYLYLKGCRAGRQGRLYGGLWWALRAKPRTVWHVNTSHLKGNGQQPVPEPRLLLVVQTTIALSLTQILGGFFQDSEVPVAGLQACVRMLLGQLSAYLTRWRGVAYVVWMGAAPQKHEACRDCTQEMLLPSCKELEHSRARIGLLAICEDER